MFGQRGIEFCVNEQNFVILPKRTYTSGPMYFTPYVAIFAAGASHEVKMLITCIPKKVVKRSCGPCKTNST